MNEVERDLFYLQIADQVALAGTCPRRKVGAVLVSPERRIAIGFNGAASGLPECEDGGCLILNENEPHCLRTVHAEINAVMIAGTDTRGGTLYVTCQPCWECTKVIINAKIKRVVWRGESYRDTRAGTNPWNHLTYAGIQTDAYPGVS